MPFRSTLPPDAPELDRVSSFTSWAPGEPPHSAACRRLAERSGSLWQDLWCPPTAPARRIDGHTAPGEPPPRTGHWRDVIQALAASLRHAQALTVHLQCEAHVVPLTLYPLQRLARCPFDTAQLQACRLEGLRVLHVEPALLDTPSHPLAGALSHLGPSQPLAPMGWLLALRGPRREVLPELAGALACRRVPGLALHTPGLSGAVAGAMERLGRTSASLRTIASWPGMDAVRAARLVNGLYLQGALIVSRTHPAAHER